MVISFTDFQFVYNYKQWVNEIKKKVIRKSLISFKLHVTEESYEFIPLSWLFFFRRTHNVVNQDRPSIPIVIKNNNHYFHGYIPAQKVQVKKRYKKQNFHCVYLLWISSEFPPSKSVFSFIFALKDSQNWLCIWRKKGVGGRGET